jgi:hypothetical protein
MQEALMRVDTLHRRIAQDVSVMYDDVSAIFPARMPKAYVTRSMNIRQFLDKLNRVCEPYHVFNEIKDDPTLAIGEIIQTGIWVSADELPENGSAADARVIWNMHPDTKRFQWSNYYWNRKRFYFWQLMMHELIHRHQDTAPNGDRDPRRYRVDAQDRDTKLEQEYLGNCDEIETHAHDAALELFVWWPQLTFRQAVAAAKEIKGPTPPTMHTYTKTFSPSHPALKHFKRKLRAWYDTLQKNAEFYQSLQLAKIA